MEESLKQKAKKYLSLAEFSDEESTEIIKKAFENTNKQSDFMPFIIQTAKIKLPTANHKPLALSHMTTADFE